MVHNDVPKMHEDCFIEYLGLTVLLQMLLCCRQRFSRKVGGHRRKTVDDKPGTNFGRNVRCDAVRGHPLIKEDINNVRAC